MTICINFCIHFTYDFIICLCSWKQPSNSTEETLMPPRLPALIWRLVWMSSTLSAHPPLHPQASGLRTRTPPSMNPYRRELVSPAPSSRTSPKPSSSPSHPEQPSPTTLKTACWPCLRPSTRRQGPPSTSCCLTWWMKTVMMTWWWQAAWKLPPPHQPSKQATHNYVTPCAPVQHCRLAHQHHQPPRSISHNPAFLSELHQKLVIEAKLPSSTDPWSHPDFTSSSFSSSPSNVVKCHIDQIILVLEKSYFHPLIGGPQTTEEELEMGTYIYPFSNMLGVRWLYAGHTLVLR